jgi:hypothetical protein
VIDNVNVATGSYRTQGYWTDLRVGNVFLLANTIGPGYQRMYAKAPLAPTWGYVMGLDVSGHVGYRNEQANGFTDSNGVILGTDRVQYGDVGGRARLFALVPGNGLLWMPYISGTVDRQFGFSNTSVIPNQPAVLGGDVVFFQQANTFWGGDLGLDVRTVGGWVIGAKGFYSRSSDTTISGGRLRLSIPFSPPPMVVASNPR